MTNEEMVYYLKRADITIGQKCKTKTAEAIEKALEIIEQHNFEDMSNGDVIKAMFPNVEIKEKNNGYEVYFGVGTAIQFFNYQWWKSPYKEAVRNERKTESKEVQEENKHS